MPADGSRPPEPIELSKGQAAGIESNVWLGLGLDMDWGGDRIVVGARIQGKADYDLLQLPLDQAGGDLDRQGHPCVRGLSGAFVRREVAGLYLRGVGT